MGLGVEVAMSVRMGWLSGTDYWGWGGGKGTWGRGLRISGIMSSIREGLARVVNGWSSSPFRNWGNGEVEGLYPGCDDMGIWNQPK